MLNSPNSWNYISTKIDMKPGFGTIKQITDILFFNLKQKILGWKVLPQFTSNQTSLVDDQHINRQM